MANALHDFLSAGFAQAVGVMGETFTLGAMTGLNGFFAAVDTSLEMQISGYTSEADWTLVADKVQFTTAPALKNKITKGSDSFLVVEIKTDLSAYVLGLKKISQ